MLDILIYSTVVHCKDDPIGEIEILENMAVGVKNGAIVFVTKENESHNEEAEETIKIEKPGFLCPGMVDTHFHAPQDEYKGTGLDLPVMDWLQKYTFPAEMRISDIETARKEYSRVVSTTLRNGTTTCVYFASIHTEGSVILAEECLKQGQRAFVGKVSMDRNSPDGYVEADSVNEFKRFLEKFPTGNPELVQPIVTPRFVPTCSQESLKGLGEVKKERKLRMTTHVAESIDEVMFCQALKAAHGGEERDLAILDDAGLLEGSILAHAVHLSDEELKTCRDRGAAIAHCPLSNCYFGHSVLRVKEALSLGVAVGLATDVAGGYDPSMLSAIRHAMTSSHLLSTGVDKYLTTPGAALAVKDAHTVSFGTAFYLATLGGARCTQTARIGAIRAGYCFDALWVDPLAVPYRLHVAASDSVLEVFQKWLHLGDDRCLKKVWVDGRAV